MKYQNKFYVGIAMAAIIAIGCGMGSDTQVKAADTPAPAAAAGGANGSITGTIKLEGTAPKMRPINMKADPVCAQAHSAAVPSEEVVVGAAGELANVIVYLDEVKGEFKTPETPVVLDQKGCQYTPHVLALYDGQPLEIKNSDKTLHNVHCFEGTATCFNRAMFQGMAPIKHKFNKAGNIVKFKCDVHPWMTAYALVAKNPFFATTKADGKFEIKNIPAGDYTVKIWHEKFGEQTKAVKVTAGAAANADASFKVGS